MNKYFLMISLILFGCSNTSKNNAARNKLLTDNQITIVFFLNTECPVCQKYQGSLKSIYQKFNNDFKYYYVFPGKQSDVAIKSFCDYDSIPKECIVSDPDMNISKAFGATITPQGMIFKNKELQYSGKIDDRFETISSHKTKASVNYIEKALFSLQKNEVVEINKTNPVGCFIESD